MNVGEQHRAGPDILCGGPWAGAASRREIAVRVLKRDDVPVLMGDDTFEVRTTEVGDLTAAFISLKAGTDLGPALVGLPDDLCQCPHWGYMFKGKLKMRTKEGEEVYEGGQAFYWEPGHAPVALTDCEYIDYSPTVEFKKVLDHISGGG